MRNISISADDANAIWDILVQFGTPEFWRDSFVAIAQEGFREYRFQGEFGFGGKLWNHRGSWSATYYPEDRNPSRDSRLAELNVRLASLKSERVVTA